MRRARDAQFFSRGGTEGREPVLSARARAFETEEAFFIHFFFLPRQPRSSWQTAIRLFGESPARVRDVPSLRRKDVFRRAISRVVRVARTHAARARVDASRVDASRARRARLDRAISLSRFQCQKNVCSDCLPIPAKTHRRAAQAKKPRRPPLFFAVRIRFWRTLPSAPISLQKSVMTCHMCDKAWERRRGSAGGQTRSWTPRAVRANETRGGSLSKLDVYDDGSGSDGSSRVALSRGARAVRGVPASAARWPCRGFG